MDNPHDGSYRTRRTRSRRKITVRSHFASSWNRTVYSSRSRKIFYIQAITCVFCVEELEIGAFEALEIKGVSGTFFPQRGEDGV